MQDVRENFAVVREQSSWGDTDPFCCGKCQSPNEPTSPPNNTILLVDPENRGDDEVSMPYLHKGSWEENLEKSPLGDLERNGDSDSCCVAATAIGETTGEPVNRSAESRGHDGEILQQEETTVTGRGTRRMSPSSVAFAAEFSTHLHGVDKYPLDFVRLCRFAQFLTGFGVLREAYEVRRGDAVRGSRGIQHLPYFTG